MKNGHEAFNSKAVITGSGYAMAEHNAMANSGLSDDEWYAMTREDRARRTVHLLLSGAVQTLNMWANKPKKNS